jgi:hypothetical protein
VYQQNPYQQQGFGGQFQNQQANPSQSFNANQQINQGQQSVLQEQDLANVVLNELKRVAREYTTAVLEANNLETRQTFQFLLQKALHDQAILYQQIQQMNGYGEIPIASQQDIQQELHNQSHSAPQLHAFVQQNQIGSLSAQSQQQNQVQNQQQNQQTQGMGQQQAFQTSQIPSTSPLYPYGIYGQASITNTGTQMPSQSSGNNVSQGFGQNQGAGISTSVGMGTGSGAMGTGAATGTGTMGWGTSSGAGTSTGMGSGAGSSTGTGTSTGMGSGTGTSDFGSGHVSSNQGHQTQSSSSASHNHPSSGYYASSDPDQSEQKLGSSSETGNPKSIGRKVSLNRNAGSKYSF